MGEAFAFEHAVAKVGSGEVVDEDFQRCCRRVEIQREGWLGIVAIPGGERFAVEADVTPIVHAM